MQIDLVSKILLMLKELGVKDLNTRQLNVVVRSANDILREIDTQHRPAVSGSGLEKWMASDETGLSSLYLASVLSGKFSRKCEVPYDVSDFGRCVGLLEAVPELRAALPKLSESGSIWSQIGERWEELERLYHEEKPSGKAPRLYAAIRDIHKKGASSCPQ